MGNSNVRYCNKCGIKLTKDKNWYKYCYNNYTYVCRPCYLEKARQRERKRTQTNKDNLYELKSNGCAICGYNKYNGSLDFHHVNQEDKSFFLGVRSMHRKDEEIIDEVNKCILLCSNCHREIHHIELKKLKEEII